MLKLPTKAKYPEETVYYLAGPYNHVCELVRERRFNRLTEFAARLTHAEHLVFSPITHGHPMAIRHELPKDYAFWKLHCEAFVSSCDIMIVVMLPGWKQSVGVRAEIKFAKKLGIPVHYLSPKTGIIYKNR